MEDRVCAHVQQVQQVKKLTLHQLIMVSVSKDLDQAAAFVFNSLLWVFEMLSFPL